MSNDKDEKLWFIRYHGQQLVFWFRRFKLTRNVEDYDRAELFADELREQFPFLTEIYFLNEIVGLIEGLLAGKPNLKD